MGVNFYICAHCGDIFPDGGIALRGCRGEYRDGVECETLWCCYECAKADGYTRDENGVESCNYCREEKFTPLATLKFLVSKGLLLTEVWDQMREEKFDAHSAPEIL